VNFWDSYDARPLDMHPGHEPRPANVVPGRDAAVTQCSHEPCSQNDTAGVCDWCGVASDDVLLGVCADCT
jgi:hypothetical protein